MKLTFIGAAHEVTGSCHFLQAAGKNILIDCGMEQGPDLYENPGLPIPESEVDYVFLTHAHIDHSGMLPRLVKRGFAGQIFATFATVDLCGIMLRDSAHIQEFEAVGNCYVEYPEHPSAPRYTGQGLIPEDDGWSMKVKLASSAVPEGVWLRLPDYSAMTDRPDEVALALDELKTRSLENCMLLDVRCSLPELGNLMEQYDSALELVNDGSDLGYVLDEQGQGMPHFMERFAAALEFEHCRDLRLALDISQNLHCYEWVPRDGLKDFGRRKLLEAGVSEELLDSGCIDLEGYGADLLEEAGYVLTADESAYITRNNLEFLRDWSTPEEAGLSMEQQ